jgi:RimJ/RimL family protein N-acetyltransferase
MNQDHIISLISPDNARSIRVAERLGEKLEATVAIPDQPPDKPALQYGLTRREWELARRTIRS